MREDVHAEVGHIATLDGVRGLAVLWVMLFHYVVVRGAAVDDPYVAALARFPAADLLLRNGYLGVDLFFLVSGFLLTLPWFAHARAGRSPPSTRAFYARRIRRIVPAYYVQLAVLFALVMPLLHGLRYWRSDLYVYAWNAFAHALFLHGTTPLTSGSLGVNGALWTLAVEAQYYLLVPLVAPVFVRSPRAMLVLAFALAAAWQWGARHDLHALVAWELALGQHWGWPEDVVRRLLTMQLPGYLAHFALGILLGRAWLVERARGAATNRYARFALAFASLGLLAAALARGGENAPGLAMLALAALLFLAATARGLAARLLGRGALAFSGRVSYSAYLYHLPLLALLDRFDPGARLAALPLYLGIVLGVAWLSWRFVERPFLAPSAPPAERETDAIALSAPGSASPP